MSGGRFVKAKEGQRWSVYTIDLSTNVRPHSDEERKQLETMLVQYQKWLATPDGYDAAFGSFGADDEATIKAGDPEVGTDPRGSRVHVHFTAETLHEGQHNISEIQASVRQSLIDFAATKGIELNGAYAHVKINNSSYGLNYSIKNRRQRKIAGTQYLNRLEKELAAAKKTAAKAAKK